MENDEDGSCVDECSDDFKMSEKMKEKAKETLMFKEEVGAHFSVNLNISYQYLHINCMTLANFEAVAEQNGGGGARLEQSAAKNKFFF